MVVTTHSPDSIDRRFLLSLTAAISCAVAFGIGLSLSVPLLSFALDARGVSKTMIGVNTAMGGLATILLAPFISRLAAKYGLPAMLYGAIVLGVASLLGFLVVEPLWAWFVLRFTLGAALTVLFVLSEFWINAEAPPERRGLILGIYASALSIGFAIGPQALAMVGTSGPAPYVVGAALFALAAAPVLAARSNVPAIHDEPSAPFAAFLWAAPTATLAALVFGAAETGAFALVPLYGVSIGLDAAGSATLISAVALGNLLFQIPLGLLADRIDKRYVLIGCAFAGVAGMVVIIVVPMTHLALMATLFVWGGIVAGLYTVGLAHLGARFSGADLAQANAAFIVMYSVGMMVGPPVIGAAMDVWTPHGLPASLAILFALYGLIAVARMASGRGRS